MKPSRLFFGMALLLGTMALPASAQVSNDNEDGVYKTDSRMRNENFVQGQVLVKFKDSSPVNVRRAKGKFQSADCNTVDAVLQQFGVEDMEKLLPNEKPSRKMRKAKAFNGTTIEEKDLSQLYLVKLSKEKVMQTRELVDELGKLSEVEFAEPNYKAYIMGEPTDGTICADPSANPLYSQQWGISNMAIDQLWTKPVVNSQRPVIAIIDTGVDITHPDLVDNIWTNQREAEGEEGYDNDNNGFKNDVHGWDFINNTGNIRDYNSHGTHVAGIAAAADNGIGIIGANPRAFIMPVSVMQSDGSGDIATIIKGIDYAVQNGATVLNMSFGSYTNSKALRQALERAYQSAVLVAASGNDGIGIYPECGKTSRPMFPAAYSFVLGVQATTQSGTLAGFSNYDCDGPNFSAEKDTYGDDGYNYEMSAPGAGILSTVPNGNYKQYNGTSMAAPLVAGGISALQMVKEYDNQEILWGDLLHSTTLIGAYDITERPAELALLGMQFNDRQELTGDGEADYSNDGQFDAGETISIYPVVRTVFGPASNIKLHLEMGDEYEDPTLVSFSDEPVDFGKNLSPYGKGVSQNPLMLTIRGDVPDNRHIKMKMVATCDGSLNTIEQPFTIIVTNMVKLSGLITEDHTLTADHVYYVNDNLAVNEGTTLTIEPGTRLEFAEGKYLQSFGKLKADGIPGKPIVFTGHQGVTFGGIRTHARKEGHESMSVYTNDDHTIFTLMPTKETPNEMSSKGHLYRKGLRLSDYVANWPVENDFSYEKELLTDPNYITNAMLQLLSDNGGSYSIEGEDMIDLYWCYYDSPKDIISYCIIEGGELDQDLYKSKVYPIMNDCIINSTLGGSSVSYELVGKRNNITGHLRTFSCYYSQYANMVNSVFENLPTYSGLGKNNFFNNNWYYYVWYKRGDYWLAYESSTPSIDKSDIPAYLGTVREDLVRPHVQEMGNGASGFGTIDLSNMPNRPYAEAHGIVWKVVVNGKDAQDEYEDLAPLGVARHKFEVYFNRPMNKAVAPKISFGLREPYTQNVVDEDGSWNEDGTIYTAYKTITGRTMSDGVNRIYVYGAEDDEYFEIPYEKSRFNINIQAAGSMATGFAAEAGLGKVDLTWNNENNNFEDAMGFNVYRYQASPDPSQGGETMTDTIRINQEMLDIAATEFTDYEVKPGETYYYYYKVLSTDLKEYDVSNVVAATPLTSTKGDANGSGDVDVADVITTVNYAAGQEPKPFIYEAADMNTDQAIDILDVIGIIKVIMNPDEEAQTSALATATYTVEDGTVYVDSPVALAGVQVQLATEDGQTVTVADDLKGFETTSAWLTDNDYLFLGYSMSGKTLAPGKHALLNIGTGQIAKIRLSDMYGRNVEAIGSETTGIDRMGKDVMTVKGVYNMSGQKVAGSAERKNLPKGVYIINGEKVVK